MGWRNRIKTLGVIIAFLIISASSLSYLFYFNLDQSSKASTQEELGYSDGWSGYYANHSSQFINLSIELVLSKNELVVGDVLYLSLRIINVGEREQFFSWSTGGYKSYKNEHPNFERVGFFVEGKNGIVYRHPPIQGSTLQAFSSITFEPNQIVYFNYSWDLSCNTRLFFQPAGNHTIHILIDGIEEPIAEDSVYINYDRYYLNDIFNATILIAVLSIVISLILIRNRRRKKAEFEDKLDDE